MAEQTIRPLEADDLERVCTIEQTVYEVPWSDQVHQDCLERHYPSLILEIDEVLAGYAVFQYFVDESHLLNLAVDPCFQGQGLGRDLLRSVERVSLEDGMRSLFLEVRFSNPVARNLYLSEGFAEIGIRRNYYPTRRGREHAYVLSKRLD